MRANCAIRPTDSAEMIDTGLFIREDLHHRKQRIELLEHDCRRFVVYDYIIGGKSWFVQSSI